MGRKPVNKASRRYKLRLDGDVLELCDRWTVQQISEVLEVAVRSGIRPGQKLGVVTQAIIRPPEIKTKTIAKLSVIGKSIQIQFPEKREDFRLLLKSFLYEWKDGFWCRGFESEDVVCDRASEIASEIVRVGFVVQVEHTGIRDLVISGGYEPEQFRKVLIAVSGAYKGWFVFEYPRSDDFYSRLMKLTAAKYAKCSVRVPPEHFAEVEDFAEQNGFQFSTKALQALEEARALWESALLVMPKKKSSRKKAANPIDDNSVLIPDALKDDNT